MLILASTSPRRRDLLQQIGVEFVQSPVNIDETPLDHETPKQYVERLALGKAQSGFEQYVPSSKPTNSTTSPTVMGADTCVVLDQTILGKPNDEDDAFTILQRLSGRTHDVLSAVALVNQQQQQVVSVSTQVQFREVNDELIKRYIATREPMDKAGAYGIQGMGAILVAHIHGCYSNVVGLPLAETARLLEQFSIPVWNTHLSNETLA